MMRTSALGGSDASETGSWLSVGHGSIHAVFRRRHVLKVLVNRQIQQGDFGPYAPEIDQFNELIRSVRLDIRSRRTVFLCGVESRAVCWGGCVVTREGLRQLRGAQPPPDLSSPAPPQWCFERGLTEQ